VVLEVAGDGAVLVLAGVEGERAVDDLDAERVRQRDRPVGASGG
jgi:hypothetical protein